MKDERDPLMGNNRVEDVRWLCSLTNSQLDLLIGLKSMVIGRAKKIGRVGLAEKWDLKMYRGLSYMLMENIKDELSELAPGFTESSTSLEECKLLEGGPDDSFANLSKVELRRYIYSDWKKRISDMFDEDMLPPNKKQKTDKTDAEDLTKH